MASASSSVDGSAISGRPGDSHATTAPRRHPAWFGWVTLAARLILGGVLVWAGLLKIVDINQSVVAVQAYEFPLPSGLVTLVGYGLPIVETLLGLVLIVGIATRWAGLVAGIIMLMYIAAITSAWARGLSIDCGCLTPGGVILDPSQETKYLQDILRDVGLVVCAAWLVVFPGARLSLDAWLGGKSDEPGDSDWSVESAAGGSKDQQGIVR